MSLDDAHRVYASVGRGAARDSIGAGEPYVAVRTRGQTKAAVSEHQPSQLCSLRCRTNALPVSGYVLVTTEHAVAC